MAALAATTPHADLLDLQVGEEEIDLLRTGRLVLPLDIELGRLSYKSVAVGVERLLERVKAAAASALPDHPDAGAAEALVLRAYRRQVLEA